MSDAPGDPIRRRRRRRATRGQGAPAAAESVSAAPTAEPAAEVPARVKARRRRAAPEGAERGLHDIVGAGHSQLGVSGALRARDVNRPTADDLAAAERDVVVVRRNWTPDERG